MLCQCLCLCLYLWLRWCSGRRRARPPARLGVLTSFGAAPRSPPVPSGPSGALHTVGAGSLMCALRVDSLSGQAPPPSTGTAARPCHRLRAPRPGAATVHGRRSQALPPPTGAAARRCHRLRAPRPGAATAYGCRGQVLPPSTGAAARRCHRPRVPQPGLASKLARALCPSGASTPAAYVVLVCPGPDAAYGCPDGFW